MTEYYIGQKFSGEYPAEAAEWCMENDATISEIEPVEGIRQFEIVAVEPYVPTYDDIKQARIEYRKTHIDDKTLERQRKTANGTWTEEDEQSYLQLDADVTTWIEENLPYPVEG